MTDPEFSHRIKARHLPDDPVELVPDEAERAALARRFGLNEITEMRATVTLDRDGDSVIGTGRLDAQIVQQCAVSGEDLPVTIEEDMHLRFTPPRTYDPEADIEIELDEEDCDEIEFDGEYFDLGEAAAQTLGLAIDPYAVGPDADRVRAEKGLSDDSAPSGPFAALAALKKG